MSIPHIPLSLRTPPSRSRAKRISDRCILTLSHVFMFLVLRSVLNGLDVTISLLTDLFIDASSDPAGKFK